LKPNDNTSVAIPVTHSQLNHLVRAYHKKRRALMIWGATGIGKSQEVREAARAIAKDMNLEYSEKIKDINDEKKFIIVDMRLSQMDPSDLRGIPIFDKEKQSTVWLPPETFPRKGHGIIFFDEINLAAPLVQASAYEIILDRRLGVYTVPDGFMLVAAGNRQEDRASVYELASPLKNRFGHCQLQIPSVEEWTDWAVRHEIDIRIIGYLQWKRTSLFTFDPKVKENAFATPRSWEFCSDLIKDVPSTDIENLQLLASTEIGVGTAGELTQFIRIKDKLKDIKYYLKDPETCEIPNESDGMDLVWALITSIAEYYRQENDVKTLTSIIILLKRMTEEYSVFTLKLMASTDKGLVPKLVKIREAHDLAKKLSMFFE